MLEYKGEQRKQIEAMLDKKASAEDIAAWLLRWEAKWGVRGQIGLVNTLYRIVQARGYRVSYPSLGETISVQQNHAGFALSEKQAAAIARDIFPYAGREVAQ